MATKLFSIKVFCITSLLILLGCSTSQKQRMEQRDKVSAASGMYCEFLSGDIHNDIDVELVLQMGKRCDANKPYSITNYKTSSENYGVIYCCSIKQEEKPRDSEALDEDDAEIKDHKNGPKDPNKDPLKDKLNKEGNNLKPNDANKPGAQNAKPGTPQGPANSGKPGASNPGGSAAKPSGSSPGGSAGSSSAPKPGGSSPSSPSGSTPSGGSPSTGSPNAPSTSTPSSSPSSPSASSPAKPSTPPSKPAPPKPPGPKAPQFNDADILGD